MKKYKKLIFVSISILVLIDQISKFILRDKSWSIQNQYNGHNIIISIIIIIIIFRFIISENSYIKMYTKVVLSFAIAGAFSNLIDRIWKNSVILIINLGNHIEINLAYIYILIAWIGMAIILTKNTVKMIKDRRDKIRNFKK